MKHLVIRIVKYIINWLKSWFIFDTDIENEWPEYPSCTKYL